jgi:D-3-phosphoglycerate dehydrogenase
MDEGCLKRMFEERQDFKYISDIAPDCHADLLKYENRYYSTPKKQGAETSEANINAGLAAANQIVNFIKKGDKTFQVNK